MINKCHHTQRFCVGGLAANGRTDRQTDGQAGGPAAGQSDISKDIFNLGIVLTGETATKTRPPVISTRIIDLIPRFLQRRAIKKKTQTIIYKTTSLHTKSGGTPIPPYEVSGILSPL